MDNTASGSGKKVLLGFSGGTDSCYSALKLRRLGYGVEALILDMTGAEAFTANAAARARQLGIPYSILDVREEFQSRIVDYFTDGYLSGRTPAPCTLCNPEIKWKYLYRTAVRRGFDHIATGHYFRITVRHGRHFVSRAADAVKDQSYYLWMLPQTVLQMAITPMGTEIKNQVVRCCEIPPQRESMGVCFLAGQDYRRYLRRRCAGHPSCSPGEITDTNGCIIGAHEGCAFYTIGQKKGLSLPPGVAVTAIDHKRNRIVVGGSDALFSHRIILDNWILPERYLAIGHIPLVKIRGIGVNPIGGCTVREEGGKLILGLTDPAWAAAPGQPAVFYDGDLVVGGGFIV